MENIKSSNLIKSRGKKLLAGIFLSILFFVFYLHGVSSDREDLKIIKKASKAEEFSISSKSFKEAKWLKICITEKKKSEREDVKIRIYLPFLETILKFSKNCRIKNERTDIDLREIIEKFKREGAMELFLLEDDESIVKIWLE